jgi:5-oxoprolinase (ATP-hydrolysing)
MANVPSCDPNGLAAPPRDRWRFAIDTGGTFTDCIAEAPGGEVRRVKVLSSGRLRGLLVHSAEGPRLDLPLRPAGATMLGASCRHLASGRDAIVADFDSETGLARFEGARLPEGICELDFSCSAPRLAMAIVLGVAPDAIAVPCEVRIATTRGTNALLEGRTARPALVVNRGFADLLRIGDQTRSDLFAASIEPRRILHGPVVEVDPRQDAAGQTLDRSTDLDEEALRREAKALVESGLDAAAVALVHAHRDPSLEHRVRAALTEAGLRRVVCSTDLSRDGGLLERAGTAVVDAALDEAIRDFLHSIGAPHEPIAVQALTSAGGLVESSRYRPAESLLSGPAGGAVGVAAVAARLGLGPVIGFDMGGTSTDVVRIAGEVPVASRTRVASTTLASPCVAIHTVAAGGGSICTVDAEGRLAVGPASAGADPGPACYGRGGPLTVTDVNLLLGRVDLGRFGVPVDAAAARAAAEALNGRRHAAGADEDLETMLETLRAIADERMAGAIEAVSSREGYDPTSHALVAFGGAGGQHAIPIAERLGIETVVFPADAGLLSAVGLRHARRERRGTQPVDRPLDDCLERLESLASSLTARVRGELASTESSAAIEVDLRLQGHEHAIGLALHPTETLRTRFEEAFRRWYGSPPPARGLEVVSLRCVAFENPSGDRKPSASQHDDGDAPGATSGPPIPSAAAEAVSGAASGVASEAALHDRGHLASGHRLDGPAIVADRTATIVIESGWTVFVEATGDLVAKRSVSSPATGGPSASQVRALPGELLAARLASIAEEMGETLRRTALSVNIKHRLDYSCAILDGQGRLVVNAPHLPVHLGALGLAARTIMRTTTFRPGDVVVCNHPAFGGSHLPDVTVLTPVFASPEDAEPLAILANRAHHAEIGGTRPGSMPPSATRLVEEGVAIPPMKLVAAGVGDWPAVECLLREAPHPSRAVEENLADLAAQVAANRRGEDRLSALLEEIGTDAFVAGLADLAAHGVRTFRAALPDLLPKPRRARIELDDGTPIEVALSRTVDDAGPRLRVDFTGTAGVHPGNLNAPRAIVQAATLYVLRVLLGPGVPLHEGLFDAIDLLVPPGLLDPPCPDDPAEAPAVAAGNTETSQRVVEALMLAFGRIAAGQGTMNNVLLGNDRFGTYETLGGGAGATADAGGASAVHTHMTNTRLADPEFVERRHPLRIVECSIRRGSGGAGLLRGGDGLRRIYEALEPITACVVSEHRRLGPPGLEGGDAGTVGRQRLRRADGTVVELEGRCEVRLEPGDRLEIETPGGGGWGRAAAVEPGLDMHAHDGSVDGE